MKTELQIMKEAQYAAVQVSFIDTVAECDFIMLNHA